MTNELVKELKAIKDSLRDSVRRLNTVTDAGHADNADQIADLQEMMIDEAYDDIINDIDE